MPFGISLPELLILLVVLLLVFGAKRLPEMGKSLGKGMREFKDAVTGMDDEPDSATSTAPAELPTATSPTHDARESDVVAETEREKVS
jgi:sec-independent protein translocase protein TatA